MDRETRKLIKAEIANLLRVAAGEKVNGVRLGMGSITPEWVARAIKARREMLANGKAS